MRWVGASVMLWCICHVVVHLPLSCNLRCQLVSVVLHLSYYHPSSPPAMPLMITSILSSDQDLKYIGPCTGCKHRRIGSPEVAIMEIDGPEDPHGPHSKHLHVTSV
jgi:hypothetical protein